MDLWLFSCSWHQSKIYASGVCVHAEFLSHVQLFAIPRTVAPQAPLSMECPRQEYWSGLLCLPPGDLPNPRIKPRSPTLQADSLPTEPLGKPKNTGVGSLSLLQEIFLTQESNWGLLHCRWILYQLSCLGSPVFVIVLTNTWHFVFAILYYNYICLCIYVAEIC